MINHFEDRDYLDVMDDIIAGLTGDKEHDIQHLREMARACYDHEAAVDIVRECSHLLYDTYPLYYKESLAKPYRDTFAEFVEAMEMSSLYIYKEKYEDARRIFEPFVKEYDALDIYQNDEHTEWYCFDEPIQEILYREISESEMKFKEPPNDFPGMYLMYGEILLRLGNIDEAIEVLTEGLRWNPVSAPIALELAECYQLQEDFETFEKLVRRTLEIAYDPESLALCYRFMADCYIDSGDVEDALVMLYFSARYGDLERVQTEIELIDEYFDIDTSRPDPDQVIRTFQKLDLQMGPSDLVLAITFNLGSQFYEDQNYDRAEYLLGIFDSIYDDDKVKDMLDVIHDVRENSEYGDEPNGGKLLNDAILAFEKDGDMDSLGEVVGLLGVSNVWIPCTAVMPNGDQGEIDRMLDDAGGDHDIFAFSTYSDNAGIQLVPDTVHNGNNSYLPVFASPRDMGEYGEDFSKVEKSFLHAVLMAATNSELSGIVVNPFTHPFVLEGMLFNSMLKLAAEENGIKQ